MVSAMFVMALMFASMTQVQAQAEQPGIVNCLFGQAVFPSAATGTTYDVQYDGPTFYLIDARATFDGDPDTAIEYYEGLFEKVGFSVESPSLGSSYLRATKGNLQIDVWMDGNLIHFYVFGNVTGLDCYPTNTAQCKNGGLMNFPMFKNQGDCVRFVVRKKP